ncbi:MAG TPA: hypothetical protein PK231_04730 [Acidocella sp.]|nr:hypothetical protein [Acidocella sp.]
MANLQHRKTSTQGKSFHDGVEVHSYERAMRLWEAATPIANTPGEVWLQQRGLGGVAASGGIRYTEFRHRPGAPLEPIFMGLVLAGGGDPLAVHVTDRQGRTFTMGGKPAGGAVRLGPAARELLIGKGLFDTAQAAVEFGMSGRALLTVRNLVEPPHPILPLIVSRCVITVRGDPISIEAAQTYRRALIRSGIEARIETISGASFASRH